MSNHTSRETWRWAVIAVAAAVIGGCASEPPPPPAPKPVAPAPVVAPQPVAPPEPALPPAQAKAQAQKLAIEAVDLLQNGDEAKARSTLEKATALDPSNDLARKLMDQIKADAQKELGATFFRYTVQTRRLAVEARAGVHGRPVPVLHPRQVQRHREPEPARRGTGDQGSRQGAATGRPYAGAGAGDRAGGAAAPQATEPAPAAEAEAAPAKATSSAMQQGRRSRRAATSKAPTRVQRGRAQRAGQQGCRRCSAMRPRSPCCASYDREAAQAYQRQNLDLAIKKWDRILELDPNNQKAKLERERAVELKKKMNEKFGTAGSSTDCRNDEVIGPFARVRAASLGGLCPAGVRLCILEPRGSSRVLRVVAQARFPVLDRQRAIGRPVLHALVEVLVAEGFLQRLDPRGPPGAASPRSATACS